MPFLCSLYWFSKWPDIGTYPKKGFSKLAFGRYELKKMECPLHYFDLFSRNITIPKMKFSKIFTQTLWGKNQKFLEILLNGLLDSIENFEFELQFLKFQDN